MCTVQGPKWKCLHANNGDYNWSFNALFGSYLRGSATLCRDWSASWFPTNTAWTFVAVFTCYFPKCFPGVSADLPTAICVVCRPHLIEYCFQADRRCAHGCPSKRILTVVFRFDITNSFCTLNITDISVIHSVEFAQWRCFLFPSSEFTKSPPITEEDWRQTSVSFLKICRP